MNHERRSKPRRVYLTSKRAHEELKRMLQHHHELLHDIKEGMIQMAGEIERVLEEVAEIKGKVTSMAALLAKLAQLIRDNAGNPAVLNQIADDLDASSKEAQAAIDANDPDATT